MNDSEASKTQTRAVVSKRNSHFSVTHVDMQMPGMEDIAQNQDSGIFEPWQKEDTNEDAMDDS